VATSSPTRQADLPPEQYAYRPGRNAQQAVVEVGALLDHGHLEVVDADLADYFRSVPHAVSARIGQPTSAGAAPCGDQPPADRRCGNGKRNKAGRRRYCRRRR
jgi:hypothetical protein